ncbi:hypothetical protein O7635_23635 [Asanoa sp. WMMD1127]|nr:hypothetical protein [Asanoa sp. WMMD1127]MDG4824852.1 hypothetical protein [Asanoa sp. WMMD1127]
MVLTLPSARKRHEQAVAMGIADVPPEPAELHLSLTHHRKS